MPLLSLLITVNIAALILWHFSFLWITLAVLVLLDLIVIVLGHKRGYSLSRFRVWELILLPELGFRILWNIVGGLYTVVRASQLAHSDVKRLKRVNR